MASVQMAVSPQLAVGTGVLARADSATLEVTVDSSAKEIILTVGPFDLTDRTGEDVHDHSGAGHDTPVYHFDWPIEGWLRGFHLQAMDGEGNVLPQRIVHHMIVVNFDRRQLVYPAAERIMGFGTETQSYVLPKSIGVPVRLGSDLGLYVAWHNTTGARIEKAYFQLRLVWTPKNQVPQPLSGLPVYFDVNLTIGGTNTYDIPPGRSEKSFEFTIPESGRLLGVGGHIHDFGVEVRLEDAETDKVITRIKTELDENGWVTHLERHLFAVSGRGKKLKAGHRYRVVGVYDNPTGKTLELGAMSHMVGLFAPDDITKWPAIDLDDPEYQKDIASLADQFSKMKNMNMDHEHENDDGE